MAGEVLARLCPRFSGQEGPVFRLQRWARRGEPVQEASRTPCSLSGLAGMPFRRVFPCSRLPRALQTRVRFLSTRPGLSIL